MTEGEKNLQNFDEPFGLPEEFNNEPAEEEIIYDWDGGVFHENEQDA